MIKNDIRYIVKRIILALALAFIFFFLKSNHILAATVTPTSSKYDVRYTTVYCTSYNTNGECIYDSWGTWKGQANIGTQITSPSETLDAITNIGFTINIPNMPSGNTYTFNTTIEITPSSSISAANSYSIFKTYYEVVNVSAGTTTSNRTTDNVSSYSYTLSQTGTDNVIKLSVSVTLSSNANYISFYLRDESYGTFRPWIKYFWDNNVKATSLTVTYTEGSNSYIQQNTQVINNLLNVFKANSREEIDYLKDNSDASVDVSGMSDITGILPPGPIDSVLALPLYIINKFIHYTGAECYPLSFTFVWDMPITLPCFDSVFWSQINNMFIYIFLNDLPAALLFMLWCKSLYKRVERATSFESTTDDAWGGV